MSVVSSFACIDWSRFSEFLPLLMLTRVPLLCALTLILFPVLSLTKARSLLANLFDVGFGGMIVVTVSGLAAAWTTLLTGWVVLYYGKARFPGVGFQSSSELPGSKNYAWAATLALVVIGAVLWYAPRQIVIPGSRPSDSQVLSARLRLLAGTALGAAAGAGLLWLAGQIYGSETRPQTGIAACIRNMLEWAARKFLQPDGYLYPAAHPLSGHLLPGHLLAAVLFLLTFLLYLLIGGLRFVLPRRARIPTLTYVLLLITLACWSLSAITFAADRWRIPIMLIVGVVLLLTAWLPNTDHFYATRAMNIPRAPDPAEVVLAAKKKKVIVVAASGGGIQAAAWTARVLTGLEIQCRHFFTRDPGRFGTSICLISSVSGGSVGAMYFVNQYDPSAGLPDDASLEQVVNDAGSSSLEDVAWGLTYPDLWRTVVPVFPPSIGGRGRALERAWTHASGSARRLESGLSGWIDGVAKGLRPANIFNATLAETGDRLLLSTTYLPLGTAPPARWDFYEMYKKRRDLAIVTAARLSATFPYVTPASRADAGGIWTREPHPHVVDGGYYDNYGLSTAVEWLDSALELLNKQGKLSEIESVLLLQIHETADPINMDPPAGSRRSWFYQLFAPLAALFAVRTAGQRSHNQVELKLLQEKWAGKVAIQPVAFEFGGRENDTSSDTPKFDDPPLSWHLTPRQKQAIEEQWNIRAQGPGWEAVRNFLT